jgi:hypothetical protein
VTLNTYKSRKESLKLYYATLWKASMGLFHDGLSKVSFMYVDGGYQDPCLEVVAKNIQRGLERVLRIFNRVKQ